MKNNLSNENENKLQRVPAINVALFEKDKIKKVTDSVISNIGKNSSTLSLHICAYENASQDLNKQNIKNPLKISTEEKTKGLEIMQFKASQKLCNPFNFNRGKERNYKILQCF